MTPPAVEQVLAAPMDPTDSHGAATVGDYLVNLLAMVWQQADAFSGKRPFGFSSWPFDIYKALGRAGLIGCELDEDGYVEELDDAERGRADEMVALAIESFRRKAAS